MYFIKMFCVTQAQLTFLLIFLCIRLVNADQRNVCEDICKCTRMTVDCNNLNLTSIPRGIPATAVDLFLEQNNIKDIEKDPLQGLNNLKKLYLGKNGITNIENNAFQGLGKLEALYLESNGITNIEEGAFKGLVNLKILELENNNITSIHEGDLKYLFNLKELNIDSNKITDIEEGSFNDLHNLNELRLSTNKITNIEGLFQHTSNLTKLRLAYNSISNITEDTFKNLNNLEELDLSGSKVTNIENGSWQGLQNLKRLILPYNSISNITEDTFKTLGNLEELYLSQSGIRNIENGSWQGLQSLKILDLSQSRVTNIENGSWQGLQNLKILDLSQSRITNIQNGSWQGLQNLKKLILTYNSISNIKEGSFKNLGNLEELDLTLNGIKNIENGSWQGLQNLKILNLTHNLITNIKGDSFKNLGNLEELDLSNNQIKQYEDGAFSSLLNITEIDLRGNNDMVCVCHLPDFINYINKTYNRNVTVQGSCIDIGNKQTKLTHTQKPSQCKSHTINEKDIQCYKCLGINCNNAEKRRCQGIQPVCMTRIAMNVTFEKLCGTYKACSEAREQDCENWKTGSSCVTCCNGDLCNTKTFQSYTHSFELYLLYTRKHNGNENLRSISKELEKEFLNMTGIYTVNNCGVQSKVQVFILQCHVPKSVTKEQVKEKALDILKKSQRLRNLGLGRNIELTDKELCYEVTSHNGVFQWPVTKVGDTAFVPCRANIATRGCVRGTPKTPVPTCSKYSNQLLFTGVWKKTDMSQCNNTEWITKKLKEMQGDRIDKHNIEDLFQQLSNISQRSVYFKEIHVVLMVDIYKKLMPSISNMSANAKNDILLIINNIINTPEKILIKAEISNRSVSSVLNIMEKVSEILQVEKQQFKVLYPKFGIGITKGDKKAFNGLFYGILSATNKTKAKSELYPYPNGKGNLKMMDYISIPKSILNKLKNHKRSPVLRISFYSMLNDKLYRVVQKSRDGKNSRTESFINSRIIGANIAHQRISNLEEPITISFNLLHKNGSNSRCVFWDDKSRQNPHWSTSGCKTERKEKVYCSCNHLTSFAILTDIDQNVKSYIICYIGCGISLTFLVLTMIIHAGFKNLWKVVPSKILVNLCGCLAVTHLIILVGMRPGKNMGVCKRVAILFHYFLIASAMWITVEALHICQALIAICRACQRSFVTKSSIFAWGVPAIIIIFILIITKTNSYIRIEDVCWLSKTPLYVAFLFPMMAILLFNLIVYLLITGRLVSMKKEKQCEHKTRKFRLFGIVVVLFLFGASCALAHYIFFNGGTTVFIYLCAIVHALQGLFIFIFYCICDRNARNVICSNSCKKKKYVLNKNSKNNSGESPDNETQGVKYSNSEDKTSEVKL